MPAKTPVSSNESNKGPKMPKSLSPHEMPATLELKESQLPQIKDWKIGSTYKIIVEVEQVSIRKPFYPDEKGGVSATFKVLSAKSAGESKTKDNPEPASRGDKLNRIKDKAAKY